MALQSVPFKLKRDLVVNGRSLCYQSHLSQSGGTTGTYNSHSTIDYTNTYGWSLNAGNEQHIINSWWDYGILHSYDIRYHRIAYAYDNRGWWLEEVNTFEVPAGGNGQFIATHNQNNSIINFVSEGTLYLDTGNSVKVNAPQKTNILGGTGTITASAGAVDKFILGGPYSDVNGNTAYSGSSIYLHAGVGADQITVVGNSNHVYGEDDADEIVVTINSHSNHIDSGDANDKITVEGYSNQIIGGNGDDKVTITATGSDNVIYGDDTSTSNGGSGKDEIEIAGSRNYIWGGGGDDKINQTVNYTYPAGSDNHVSAYGGVYSGNDNEIHGGSGKDEITVTNHNAWQVEGGDDSDVVTIGSWNSDVEGGGGNDIIDAADCNNIYGGHGRGTQSDGADTIHARNGNSIWGEDGVDSIVANNSNRIWGNKDGDSIWGNDYNFISGGGAADTIFASEYNTVLGGITQSFSDDDVGGPEFGQDDGADSITVEIGNKVYGGGGNDSVHALDANLIYGNAGDDSIVARDKDSISGGDGADCIKASGHAYVDAGPNASGTDIIDVGFNSSVWGYTGVDSINAGDRSYVDGGSGFDSILAKDDSTILGGWDNDSIDASDGNLIYGDDSLNRGSGTDSVNHGTNLGFSRYDTGVAGNDSIHALNRNTIYGGYGADSIVATDFNIIDGGYDNDSLDLHKNNTISGGQGNDTILASDHNLIFGEDDADGKNYTDAFFRSTTNDSIVGGTDNTIYSGYGNDTVIMNDAAKIDAGAGDDSISFGMNSSVVAGTGNDTIVSQSPGSSTAPNGSAGSSIWGGRGDMDSLGRPVYAWGTDVHGHRVPVDPRMAGSTDVHGHNIFTGDDALVTIMDFKFGNDVIHFGKAFEASAVTAFGYGNSTIVPTTDYQIYTAGTDRINVAATISDAANIDMQNEAGKFVMFGNPNGTLKGGFANTLIGGKNDDTIYGGEGDYVYGGLGNDTINLNGYNGWRDRVGLTAEGGTDTVSCFQQGWGEENDVVWYNVPLKKEITDSDGKVTGVRTTNTDAIADLNDANVRVVGDKTVLSQGKAKLILKGVTHGEILIEDGEGIHRTALLGDGYFNDSTRGGQIFIGRKEYSDIVSFEKNNHDLVVDLGMTKRFKDKSAKFYSIEQVIGGSGNNTLVGAKNVRNTLEGGIGTSSIWGGGIAADLMVSGTGSGTDHYTTFFYGAGDGDDTIEGFRTTERTEAHFKRDVLDIHSGDVTSVRKVGTSIVLRMAGRADRLTIRNAASGLFDQLIEVNVMGKKTAAKVTGADEIVTYDPHAQYYFSNAKAGGTVRNFGDNSRIYLDGRTGDVYRGITNIDVSAGNRLELAGDASNNRIIYRGTGTASLYGGLGNDTMTGSKDGTNRFFFGRSDGNDIITNSTVNDKVMLYDVALEEVVSAKETNGTMRIALKSGARLAIQNFDAKSVHDFTLATGDTWVYNHNATGTGGYWSPKGNYPVQPKA